MVLEALIEKILLSIIIDKSKETYNQINGKIPKVSDNIRKELLSKPTKLTKEQIDVLFSQNEVEQAIIKYLKNPDKTYFENVFIKESLDLFDEEFTEKKAKSFLCDFFEVIDSEIIKDPVLRNNLDHSYLEKILKICLDHESTANKFNKYLTLAEENFEMCAYQEAEKYSREAYKLNTDSEQATIIFGRSILSKICCQLENKELNVLVIGDIMLDRTLRGDLADNAIIGCHNTVSETFMLGNKNLESYTLGGVGYLGRAFSVLVNKVFMIVAVGNDCEGNIIRSICNGRRDYNGKIIKKHEKVNIEFLDVRDSNIITTTKIYFIKGAMNPSEIRIIRFDREERYLPSIAMEEAEEAEEKEEEPGRTIRKKIFQKFDSCINENPTINCVVIDDYEKGVITKNLMNKIAKTCKEKDNIDIYVDPKYNWNRYKGIKIKAMIPNFKECENGLNNATPSKSSLNGYILDELIIKEDKNGAEYSRDKTKYYRVKPLKNIICKTDVGCGTVFDAYFIASRLIGCSLEESVFLANCAAGIMTIKQLGEVVTPQEVIDKLTTEDMYFIDNKGIIKVLIK